MKSSVSLLATIFSSVVSVSVGGLTQPKSASLEESFQLGVGESAVIESESLVIGFEEVSSDSRCPKGEQCVWEGDATVKVWLQRGSETREIRELHTTAGDLSEQSPLSEASQPRSRAGAYEIKLLLLEPYPISGRALSQDDYQATFEVVREGSASPARLD